MDDDMINRGLSISDEDIRSGTDTNPGNFANDPQKARKAGKKGGKKSSGGGRT